MQYPIIDLITSAYLNNGWTGLDISTGKNLSELNVYPNNPTYFWGSSIDYLVDLLNTLDIGTYTLSNKFEVVELPTTGNITYGRFYITALINDSTVPIQPFGVLTDNNPYVGKIYTVYITFTITEQFKGNFNHCYYYCDASDHQPNRGLYNLYDIQLEVGNVPTTYEPYSEPKNDFPNRLKLPLPHYFPHPVIDALQRAAAGTQTTDDTEILRHYLTPLGIGGI